MSDFLVGRDVQAANVLAQGSAVALVDASRLCEREADTLLRRVRDAGLAGVALVNGEYVERLARNAEGSGLVVRPATTPAPVIASTLHALEQRQRVVDDLRQEMDLVRRAHERSLAEVQKMHEELHLAASLQMDAALGGPGKTPGVDVAVLHRPVNMVSGDVHCVRELQPGLIAFFVADAVGHGVPAALMTMLLLSGLRFHERDGAAFSPAKVLTDINAALLRHNFGGTRFATAVCGVVDVASGLVRVAGGGHPPPLVVGASRTLSLETGGPLLGVFDGMEFDETTATLGEHERLLVYTDGFEGALPRAGTTLLEQMQPVERLVRSTPHATSEDLIASIASTLDEQDGSLHQLDDVTLLAIRLDRRAMVARAAA